MTAIPEAPALNIPVAVRFTKAGTPLAVRYDGKLWAVAAEPVYSFTRDSWWETRRSVPVGIGNVVDIEHWQVQGRIISPSSSFVLVSGGQSTSHVSHVCI